MAARKTRHRTGIALIALASLAGCKAPSINLATNQPIKVDIAMRLDVYQHNAPADGAAAAKPTPTPAPGASPEERRKDRQADIQTFKNSRLVGEGRSGLLVVLVDTAGDAGSYVRRTVAQENSDRMALMKAQSEKEKRPLPEVQAEEAALWANRSFKGEWIETKQSDGSYRWIQKQG